MHDRAVQSWEDDSATRRNLKPVRNLIDATELARELAVFSDRAVRKMKLPPDIMRQPFLRMRYQRLVALVNAFGLGSPREALEGRFISKRPIEAYEHVVERIRRHAPEQEGEAWEPISHAQIEFLYVDLLQFRADATLSACAEGALECGYIYAGYAHWLSDEVLRPLQEQLARVDDALAAIIAPDGRAFAQEELVQRFGFPDVDLSAL